MKKLEYKTPEIEVTKFEVESIMDAPLGPGDDVTHLAGDGTSEHETTDGDFGLELE